MDVPFEMIDGDEGQAEGKGQRLGIGDAHEQSPGQAGTGGNGDGIEIVQGDAGLLDGGADDWNDGAKMFAAGQLGDYSAIAGVGCDLRGNNGGECARAAFDDSSGGFVAGAFNAENEAAGHLLVVYPGERAGLPTRLPCWSAWDARQLQEWRECSSTFACSRF